MFNSIPQRVPLKQLEITERGDLMTVENYKQKLSVCLKGQQ